MPTTPVKLAVMLALFLVAVSGCRSGSTASVEAPISSDDETDWFCQEDGDSGEWYCIQDDELARNPEKAERGSQ